MATINERAFEYAPADTNLQYQCRLAYIKGATDQKAIDIEKAVEWIMKTPMYAKQPTTLVEEFRNAMNE